MGGLGKRAQIIPEAIRVGIFEPRFNFAVGALPDGHRGSEQISPFCGERH